MNTFTSTLIGTLLTLGATHAYAASFVDLSVTGLITPSACTPSISSGGMVEIGKVSAGDLQPESQTVIDRRTLQMTVNCDAATLIAFKAVDNRSGTSFFPNYFGLGLINGDQKLGTFTLHLKNPIADSTAAQTIESEDGGTTWERGANWRTNNLLAIGTLADDSRPIAIEEASMDLEVATIIAPTKHLTLTNEVAIDGSATLEVVYL